MAVNRKLLQGAAGAAGGLVPSEHFGVVTYYGDGSSSNKVGDGSFTVLGLPDTGTAFPYLVSEKVYSSGKYYFEINDLANGNAGTMQCMVGIVPTSFRNDMTYPWKVGEGGLFWYQSNGQLYVNGSGSGSFGTFAAGDDVAVAVDFDNNTMTLYKNGSQSGTTISGVPSGTYHMSVSTGYNKYKGKAALKETLMQYSIPSGYEAWGGDIDTSGDWSNYSEYDGALDFQPDLVWIKSRSGAFISWHTLFDSTRGANKAIFSNATDAEFTYTDTLTSFNTDGFTLGADSIARSVNIDSTNYVAWCFKANGGTTSSNTDGAVTTTVQANVDAGFSIVEFSGTGSETTFGHGLGEKPDIVIIKRLNSTSEWSVYHDLVDGSMDLLYLNLTTANSNSSRPLFTSSVFYWVNSGDYIAYAFKSIDGFSKFGTYTGNGSTDGPIVETGFEPAFLLVKQTNDVSNWVIVDNKRSTTNPRDKGLRPNTSDSESTVSNNLVVDFLSNGFQLKQTSGSNANNGNFIYMAFAADPDTEAPTVAKSFSTNVFTDNTTNDSLSVDIGFKPGLIWTKYRGGSQQHYIYDIVRSKYDYLSSNDTYGNQNRTFGIEPTENGFTKFGNVWNRSGTDQIVAWSWKADDNEPTINTEGSIDSVVSANANAGFSIVKWTGTGAINTVGHGLSAAPEMILIKDLDSASDWQVYHTSIGNGNKLTLNTTAAASSTTRWDSTSPTATVFTLRDIGLEGELIAYCFHSVAGYSKFGSYTGIASGNVTVTTGFQPDFVMVKCVSHGGTHWEMHDSIRVFGSTGAYRLRANDSSADASFNDTPIKYTSTGFYLDSSATANSYGDYDANGRTYIYAAFKIN